MTSTEFFWRFYRVRLSHVLTEYGYVTESGDYKS